MKAYKLDDGTETWSIPGLTDEPIIGPVFGDGLVYITSYNMKTNTEVLGLPTFDSLLMLYDQNKNELLTFEEIKENKSILSRFDADGEGDHPLPGFFRFLDVDKSGDITREEWQKIIKWVDSFQQENALLAIKPLSDGGEDTKVAWKHELGVPECPSPLFYNHRIYMLKNGGIVSCLDSKTGDLKYQEKIGAGGPYYASPVVGDNKIYTASTRGVVTVFETGDKLNVLSQKDFKERIMATPALVDGRIYIRTDKSLYAFGLTK